MFVRARVVSFAVVVCAACGLVAAQTLATKDITRHYRAGEHGASVSFAGVPVFRASSIQLHSPDWKEGFYSTAADPVRVASADQQKVVARHEGRKVKFHATETYRVAGDNLIEITIEGKLESQVDAELEWAIGYVNAFALYGGGVAQIASDTIRPILPEPPRERKDVELISRARGVRLHSEIGRIKVAIDEGPAALVVLDGRRATQRWWAQEEPTLWLGILAAPIAPGMPFKFVATVEFEPKPRAGEAKPVEAKAPAMPLKQAYVPQAEPIQIIPMPRQIKWNAGKFLLSPGTRLCGFDEKSARAVAVVKREAKERFGWDWEELAGIAGQFPPPNAITFDKRRGGAPNPEGYSISVTPGTIVITAEEPAGFFYGVQTLMQMVQLGGGDGSGVSVPCAEIADWPTLAFRGVHLFTGRDAMPFHTRLVERVLSHFKMNHLVIECEWSQWDSDKSIWTPRSVPKEQLAQYAKLARDNFLEPIPLVQSLGHSEWMFRNKQNRELAEDPDAAYAYSVTNPKTYDYIRKIYQEAIELFEPKYFHIGHDEVAISGRYPHREEAKKWGETRLFIHDVKKHDEFFRERKTRMMLWGDMLLAREESNDPAANAPSVAEAKARRDAIPRDAVICDWHYDAAEPAAYKSLKLFKDESFETVACTWYNPKNIYCFAKAAQLDHAWGTLQTTWAGYELNEATAQREAKQLSAYVLAAEYAWSGQSPPPQDLPYRPEEVFARAMSATPVRARPAAGFQVPLSGVRKENQWPDDFYADLEAMPGGGSYQGYVMDNGVGVVLAGALLPQKQAAESVRLQLNATADELAFLQATLAPAEPGEEVGRYTIAYDDGSSETVALRYGREVRAWDDLGATLAATMAWTGTTAKRVPAGVRLMRWKNPHPEKAIVGIMFSSEHRYASPVLFGITGLSPSPAARGPG